MSDKMRRPYLAIDMDSSRKPGTVQSALENSLIRMPSRYLSLSLEKESEFEKPYYDTSPRKMHFDPSLPDWPDVPTIPPVRRSGGQENDATKSCPHCALAFDPIWDCAEDWGEAHAMIWCSMMPGTGDCPDCRMTVKAILGEISEIQPGSWGGAFGSSKTYTFNAAYEYKVYDAVNGRWVWKKAVEIDPLGLGYGLEGLDKRQNIAPLSGTMSLKVKVNPAIPEHVLIAEMIDGAGNYCMATLNVSCDICCDDPPTFSIASYDTTVDPGGHAHVTVTGGCPPYSYSPSGVGYTTEGNGLIGTITSAAGVCGVAYSPYTTVTVTDACGQTASCIIRNTGGAWLETDTMCGVEQSYTWTCNGTPVTPIVRYKLQMKAAVGTSCLVDCCTYAKTNAAALGFDVLGAGADCGAFCGSDFGLGAPNTNVCFHWGGNQGWVTWVVKEEWGCA